MIETKLSLSLLIPGTSMLSSQECEKNPKNSYDEHKVLIKYTKGKGKTQKQVKKLLTIHTSKQKLIPHHMNISEEAYKYMLETPTAHKYSKPIKWNSAGEVVQRIWDIMSVDDRLRKHFDMVAHDLRAVSYSYEILGD